MQATLQEFDLAIVGLGPVGAVAANLAGLAGFRTLVLERGDQPYLKPRAIVFDAEIMRIFASIGLADEIAAATRALEGSIYLGADRKPIRTFRARARAHELAWHPSNLFYQPDLERILRGGLSRFANVTVLREHEVTSVRQNDEGCTLRVTPQSGDSRAAFDVRTKFVLACDGASSTIRKSLDIALEDIGFEERWLVLDALTNGPMRWPATHAIPDEVRDGRYSLMVCDPVRPSTLIPGVGRHRRWEYMVMADEGDDDVVGDDWLRERLALWIDPANVEIIRAAVYRFRALIAQKWRDRNVFLVGDAAHQTPPFYGQGMCHGIRDAAQILWKLRLVMEGSAAPAAALDSYQVERMPHVREIIAASVAAGAQVCKLDPAAAAARDVEFRRIEAERANAPVAMTDVVPPLRAGIVDTTTGGMRLPEFRYVAADGSLRRMDELLAGRFTILSTQLSPALPDDIAARWHRLGGQDVALAPVDAPVTATRDHDSNVARWLEQQRTQFVIVRPDRYVYATAVDALSLGVALEKLCVQLGCTDRTARHGRALHATVDFNSSIPQVSRS